MSRIVIEQTSWVCISKSGQRGEIGADFILHPLIHTFLNFTVAQDIVACLCKEEPPLASPGKDSGDLCRSNGSDLRIADPLAPASY